MTMTMIWMSRIIQSFEEQTKKIIDRKDFLRMTANEKADGLAERVFPWRNRIRSPQP